MKKHIEWRDDTRQFANGDYGWVGKIRIFWVGYTVIDRADKDKPYLLNHELPCMKNNHRFATREEAYERAEKMLKFFYEHLKERMEK